MPRTRTECSESRERSQVADSNAVVGGFLRDLAFVQPSRQQIFGYKRAANAIFALETSLATFLEAGGLPRIPGIGPASLRVIHEVLDRGSSDIVEHAIDRSGPRSTAIRRVRISTTPSRDRRSPPAVCSPWTVMPTRRDSSRTRRRPWRTRGSLGSRRRESSTAGRSIGSWRGCPIHKRSSGALRESAESLLKTSSPMMVRLVHDPRP